MNRKRLYIYAVIMFFMPALSTAFSASLCNQTFNFLGKSGRTFWLTESKDGDCYYSQLIQLGVFDPNVTIIKTEFKEFEDASRFKGAMKYFDMETPVELINKNGIWKPEQGSWFIKAPEHNPKLYEKFDKHVYEGGSDGRTWIKKYKEKGFLAPEANNIKAKVLYYYPTGLYVNYSISKAYYYPVSGYIFIFTHQKRKAVGLDTMHGFILMKIPKDK